MSNDYYADLDAAKALGLEYANNGIATGDTEPLDSPLSGEWADGPTVRDIFEQLGWNYDAATDWELSDVADHWEDGYRAAEWPGSTNSED